ncbi:MAG: hypothetical protein PHY64_00720 [Eubacteriales bacterium]|nr:hypothetical protein [Eubacteriales bacterium]
MQGQANNGRHGAAMPQNIPLLSGLDNKNGIALDVGKEAGAFIPVHRHENPQALQDIRFVVDSMVGEANARNSIPDVRAQTLCFRFMLRNLFSDSKAVQDIHRQWRGAVFAYALSPLLMFAGHPLRWFHITEDDLKTSGSKLGRALSDNLSLLPGDAQWRLLAYHQNAQFLPILDESESRLAVPSASLGEIKKLREVFPWLDSNSCFFDPLLYLSEETLAYVDRWLDHRLSPAAEALSVEAHAALAALQNDVRTRRSALRNSPPYLDVWETVLQALLLRDLVDTGISVFRLSARLEKGKHAGAVAEGPQDNAPFREWDDIVARFPYGIELNGHFLGFLDREHALWLLAPGLLRETEAYAAMFDTLRKALGDRDYQFAYAYKLRSFLDTFHLPSPISTELAKRLDGVDFNRTVTFTPKPHKARKDEATRLEPPFTVMGSLCGYHCDETKLFTPQLCLFTDLADPLYSSKTYSRWSTVKTGGGTPRAGSRTDAHIASEKALLPLTVCGATLVRNSEAQRYAPNVEITRDQEQFMVTLQVPQGNLVFEWQAEYPPTSVRVENLATLPAVCYWPNGVASMLDSPWKLYYTYIHFPQSVRPVRYSTAVYDADGICTSKNTEKLITMKGSNDLHYAWQAHASDHLPSFCTLGEDGSCLGCVLFGEPAPFPAVTREALLSVDFGTTSTTGAVLLDRCDPDTLCVPKFNGSVLNWVMNGNQGVRWSLEQFIADKFNCSSKSGGTDSFFSAFDRFASRPAQSEEGKSTGSLLFTDGHIYFYGNNIPDENPMGTSRFTGLKLQDLGDTHSVSDENVNMFLEQVIETYLLACRINGAEVTEIRFAFPLAFDEEKRFQYRQKIEAIALRVTQKAGSTHCDVNFTSESQAVCAYFATIPNILAGDMQQGIITLDIGGGTSDFSYCRTNPGQNNLCYFYSNYLGGHRLVGEYAYQCKTQLNEEHADALNWMFDGLNNAVLTSSKNDRDDIEAFKNTLIEKCSDSREQFIFCIERFISLKPKLYAAALKTREFREQYMLLLFELTLLLWFGYKLGTQPWTGNLKQKVRIYLGGNGANLLSMLDPDDLAAAKDLIVKGEKVGLDTLTNHRLKREVAEGLLQNTGLFAGRIVMPETDGTQSSEALWISFSALLSRFVETFQEKGGSVVDYLASLLNENDDSARTQFLRQNATLNDVCAYLPDFCDIIISHLITHSMSHA